MEGNLSIKEAHASVSDADEPETTAPGESGNAADDGAWQTSTARRRRLLRLAVFVTGLWLGLFASGLFWAHSVGQLTQVTPAHVAVFIAAGCVPLCLIWIVALVLQRADPLLERRLAIARTLNSTIAPVDAAEAKLDRMLERLRRDIGTVDQTVVLASERISALEERFKEQVSELFSATTDAEAKSASIREQLRRERESMEGLSELLQNHLSDIRTTMAEATDTTIQSEMKSRDAFQAAATTFEDQYGRLLAASSNTVEGISTMMNGLAERTTALDAAALAATQKLDKGVSALKSHEGDYRTFVDRFSDDFKAFDGAIDSRLVALEAAQARLERGSETLFSRLSELSSKTTRSVDDALEKAKAATQSLEHHCEQVDKTSHQILVALEDQQIASNDSLEHFSSALTDLSSQLGQTVANALEAQKTAGETFEEVLMEHVLSWQKSLGAFSDVLTHKTERAGTVAADRLQRAGTQITDTMESLNAQTEARFTAQADSLKAISSTIEAQVATAHGSVETQLTKLNAQIATLTDERAKTTETADALKADVAAMPEQIAQSMAALTRTLETSQASLAAALETVEGSAQKLNTLPADLTQAWEAQVSSLDENLDALTARHSDSLKSLQALAASIQEQSETGLATISNELSALTDGQSTADKQGEALSQAFAALSDKAGALQTDLSKTDTKLADITGQFQTVQSLAEQLLSADAESFASLPSTMMKDLEAAAQKSEELRAKAISDGKAMASEYQAAIDNAGDLSAALSQKVEGTLKQITKDADKAIDLARMKWAGLSEDRQNATLKAIETFSGTVSSSLSDHAGDIARQLETLEASTRQSLARLTKDTKTEVDNSEETLRRVKALSKRLNEDTSSDLIKASSLIIDALHSSAIDIRKAMRADLTDEDWNRYLAGDKSLFTRKTVDVLSKSQRAEIANKLEQDGELKQSVLHYLKDFELLMSRAMAGGEPTSLSVALISSDIGKLYVTLSQAMRRLH